LNCCHSVHSTFKSSSEKYHTCFVFWISWSI